MTTITAACSPGRFGKGDDVARLDPHLIHVVERRADVFAGQVLAAERIDEAPECPKQHLPAFAPLGLADHDDLAAAEVDARRGVLVGHPLAQPQCVFHRCEVVAVLPHPATTCGRAEHRRMDGQHRSQADVFVLEEQHLLVTVGGHVVEDLCLVDHRIVQPPSTINTSPVTYDEASDTRNTTGPTNSSGRPRRASGVRSRTACSLASSCSPAAPGMNTSMYAGAKALPRMPCGAHSSGSDLVIMLTPPLEMFDAEVFFSATSPQMDELLAITPPLLAIITLAPAWAKKK